MNSRRDPFRCVRVIAGVWCALVLTISTYAANPVLDSINTGLKYQTKAETARTKSEAMTHYQSAIDQFARAAQTQPDSYLAHALWSECLLNVARLETASQKRREGFIAAAARFDEAVKCPGIEWSPCLSWAKRLTADIDQLAADQEELRLILETARKAYETALRVAPFGVQRVRIERGLASCLVLLADASPQTADKSRLYRAASEKFESSVKHDTTPPGAGTYALWGMALIRLARLDNNSTAMQRGIEQLEASLAIDPEQASVHYDLACALALSQRPEDALRHIQSCLKLDTQTRFVDAVAKDPDLRSLQAMPGFQDLLKQRPQRLGHSDAFQLGLALQKQAKASISPDETVKLLDQAIAQYRQATQEETDHCLAHAMWSQCLLYLAGLAEEPQRRHTILQAARDRFAIVSQCAELGWAVYYDWAKYAVLEAPSLATNIDELRAILTDAKRALESGLQRTQYSGPTARLQNLLGICLVELAAASDSATTKVSLCKQAIAKFDVYAKTDDQADSAVVSASRGLALLQLSRQQRDRVLIRQAIERLLTAVEKEPRHLVARYNLACAYALLNQPEAAVRHLRVCLERDTQGHYAHAAATDPDLATVRRQPGVSEMIARDAKP